MHRLSHDSFRCEHGPARRGSPCGTEPTARRDAPIALCAVSHRCGSRIEAGWHRPPNNEAKAKPPCSTRSPSSSSSCGCSAWSPPRPWAASSMSCSCSPSSSSSCGWSRDAAPCEPQPPECLKGISDGHRIAERWIRSPGRAAGIHAAPVAAEFLEHANEEMRHADRLAKRIVELRGQPDFSPEGLAKRSYAEYVEGDTLTAMIKEDLVAERIAIEGYRQMIAYLGENDPTTRCLLEEILASEEEHAEDLSSL